MKVPRITYSDTRDASYSVARFHPAYPLIPATGQKTPVNPDRLMTTISWSGSLILIITESPYLFAGLSEVVFVKATMPDASSTDSEP